MRRFGFAILVGLALAGGARAEDKKPGLFDFGSWTPPAGHQRNAARTLEPAALDLMPAPNIDSEARTVRLRVYADGEYRRGVVHWQSQLRKQLDRLNSVVGPVFNVQFELESAREWNRAQNGGTLEAVLIELEARDAATDVDWVIGLTTPFQGVATNVHQIGTARYLSRHFVLRAMDDVEEARALDQELNLLSEEHRARIYQERKPH